MRLARLRPAIAVLLLAAAPAATADPERLDPAKVVGPDTCARCHEAEHRVWLGTAHARLDASDQPLHRRPRAGEIAANLGVRLIRHDSLCLSCHFTPTERGGRVTALAGVSCESCHGAARDWLTVHNTFEGRQVRRAEETPDQRRRRVERNVSLGMNTPARIYDLVSRCYGCHLVPAERLVEDGKHTAGGGFDLAERVDAIRHNFVRSGRRENAPLAVEMRRKLEVLGPVLELEHGLRALAAAERADGTYAQALARRAERAQRDLRRLARLAGLPEVEALAAAAEGVRLAAGNGNELRHAADRLAGVGRAFSDAHDGSRLAALDALLGGGGGAEDGADAGGDAFAALLAAADEPAAPAVGGAAGHGATAASAAAGTARPAIPELEGEVKRRIREPLGSAAVVGAHECESCHRHERQASWWRGDAHWRSARPLLERRPRAVEIATLYYGTAKAGGLMVKGGSVCMGCHGTAAAGEEAFEVDVGVSCEHCHGPAGGYLRAHQEAGAAERRRLGMVDLGDPAVRARACASCHYVVDRRLLAAGHPPGSADFDLAARSGRIVHWSRPQPAPAALTAAWRQALQARGPVPAVRVARLDPAILRSAAGTAGSRPAVAATAAGGLLGPASGFGDRSYPSLRPAARGAGATAPAAPAALEPLPGDARTLPVDELLLVVERRIDSLFRATAGEGRR